jgi:hypothetical protein
MIPMCIQSELGHGGSDDEKPKESAEGDKCEEVAVVATANAIVQPDAVMVLSFDAAVANTAVM